MTERGSRFQTGNQIIPVGWVIAPLSASVAVEALFMLLVPQVAGPHDLGMPKAWCDVLRSAAADCCCGQPSC